ncbi:hypothetical protein [Geobacillus sp. C56-T2]|uniref:hypothetical protein n=1 Tax=Geobacillus sp. C56-T2 TaxID=600773 RepID=UPI0011A56EC1|nr:hypothetical protein [Geobacillus sp. C56-T2]TWG29515.1 hypothetical protein GC56T2_0594 [Geobacillus sp. C56-T2]
MFALQKKFHENKANPAHIFVVKGTGGVGLGNVNVKEETPEIHKEIKGQYGTIKILKPQREISDKDEDINSLLARILLMEYKNNH